MSLSSITGKLNLKRVIIVVVLSVFLLSGFVIGKNLLKPRPKYNLILISVDTLRPDHMGVYGYPKNTTPNIDKWAKNATVFTNMHSFVPSTLPSFTTLLTGKNSLETKIYNNFGGRFNGEFVTGGKPLDSNTITLAEILRGYGYKNGAFVTTFALDPNITNLKKGFDQYVIPKTDLISNKNDAEYLKIVNSSIDWLKENKNKKFFLWIHLVSPHAPYYPPQNKCTLDLASCEIITKSNLEELEQKRKNYEGCNEKTLSQDTLNLFETLYDGEIASDDAIVGNILNQIQDADLDKNSVVVFYGDHGEGFDHNYYFIHSHMLYESSTKIPLIVKLPSIYNAQIPTLLDNTAIMPLLIDLLKPNFDFKKYNNTKSDKQKVIYFVNTNLSKYAVLDGDYKYIYSIKGYSCLNNGYLEELYNLKNDPNEETNLVLKEEDRVKKYKAMLMNYFSKYGLPKAIKSTVDENEMDPEQKEIIEKLKSLGY